MTKTTEIEAKKFVTFALPAEVASAAERAAAKDLTSVAYICRRAVLNELRQRGLLAETAA